MAMYPLEEQEETIKISIARDWFPNYEYSQIGRIDFAISRLAANRQTDLFMSTDESRQYFLWAEAKRGKHADIKESFVQLILTIGKERTYENHLPPLYLGAMDAEKIAFIDYAEVAGVFTQNDFNWNVKPSDHGTKEFKQLEKMVEDALDKHRLEFDFENDGPELKDWLRKAFVLGRGKNIPRIEITKNNFTTVYYKWLKAVKPTISMNWNSLAKKGIIDADFYLADLLSEDNGNGFETIKDSLYVILKSDHYEYGRQILKEDDGETSRIIKEALFSDGQKAYTLFWSVYRRPPRKDFWAYIIDRRDLLVPQDLRERKGSYFTPQIWVEKSQEYLGRALGENWQDEYTIWDCCAGTGNLLNGLVNKYKIYASTIDQADVDVMKDRIKNGANLLESHVFQFDFLNDAFDSKKLFSTEYKIPDTLREIISNPEKRNKLLIYINPPYVEAAGKVNVKRSGVAESKTHDRLSDFLGYAKREIAFQFLARIFLEIPNCKLGVFTKLKNIQAPRFHQFRSNFNGELINIFLMPADTFDNVTGKFPISFQIWDLKDKSVQFTKMEADVYNRQGNKIGTKELIDYDKTELINKWVSNYFPSKDDASEVIGTFVTGGGDFQNTNYVRIENPNHAWNHHTQWNITKNNLIPSVVYLSARLSVKQNWLNDRDQFLAPNDNWENDLEFQSDCLVYSLFSPRNNIKNCTDGYKWNPFSEMEVLPREEFKSHFMQGFIKNLKFGTNARKVLDAGRELWKYYLSDPKSNADASFYEIRLFFQGTNEKGRMNPASQDLGYMQRLERLKNALIILEKSIQEKVYAYGFLVKSDIPLNPKETSLF